MTREHSPEVAWVLQFFTTGHLPPDLAETSDAFAELAHASADYLPNNPELAEGLRLLLQAKDCCVRAVVAARPKETP